MGNSFVLRSWDGGGGGMSARPKTTFARRAEFYDQIVSDSRLSHAATRVAWRLVNHINDETGECFPSVERLAGQLNINERTVRRGVGQLVDAGWFTKKRRGRGGTHYYANYENRAGVSGFRGEENRAGASGFTTEENRAGVSGKDGEKNRTESSVNADKAVQRNRTILPAEPKGEPLHEPQAPPGVPPAEKPPDDDLALVPLSLDRSDEGEAVRLWNDLALRRGLPPVQKMTDARRRKLRARLKDCGGLEGWRAALAKVEGIPGLLGANGRKWRADFDFLLQEKSFTKLMEGSYDHWGPQDGKGGPTGFAAVVAEGSV